MLLPSLLEAPFTGTPPSVHSIGTANPCDGEALFSGRRVISDDTLVDQKAALPTRPPAFPEEDIQSYSSATGHDRSRAMPFPNALHGGDRQKQSQCSFPTRQAFSPGMQLVVFALHPQLLFSNTIFPDVLISPICFPVAAIALFFSSLNTHLR
ncbi:hypothetical protein L2E82_35913 [Cichorium intybus]|uniref:Uncharacterized protein n=1 Tax=Cichorium intybus TaxID=13427 RepID=A0ACB9BQ68_CICIN|nr:hypothetical protein L2E82_35913 [Cichorium intybus]